MKTSLLNTIATGLAGKRAGSAIARVAFFAIMCGQAFDAAQKPNLNFLMADDMGWGGCGLLPPEAYPDAENSQVVGQIRAVMANAHVASPNWSAKAGVKKAKKE